MIVDRLENLEKYISIHPLFPKAVSFLNTTELTALSPGRIELEGDRLVVNVDQTLPKTKAGSRLETHNEYIDIQIPLSGEEIIGYTPAKDCIPEDAPYNAKNDITFFEGMATSYITVKSGMFAIFFPQDGHAPAITPNGIRKIVIKVKS